MSSCPSFLPASHPTRQRTPHEVRWLFSKRTLHAADSCSRSSRAALLAARHDALHCPPRHTSESSARHEGEGRRRTPLGRAVKVCQQRHGAAAAASSSIGRQPPHGASIRTGVPRKAVFTNTVRCVRQLAAGAASALSAEDCVKVASPTSLRSNHGRVYITYHARKPACI